MAGAMGRSLCRGRPTGGLCCILACVVGTGRGRAPPISVVPLMIRGGNWLALFGLADSTWISLLTTSAKGAGRARNAFYLLDSTTNYPRKKYCEPPVTARSGTRCSRRPPRVPDGKDAGSGGHTTETNEERERRGDEPQKQRNQGGQGGRAKRAGVPERQAGRSAPSAPQL